MRPSRIIWKVAVKAPLRAAGMVVEWEVNSRRREAWAKAFQQAYEHGSPMSDRPPPPLTSRSTRHRIVDVDVYYKTLLQKCGDASEFADVVASLTPGAVLVTLRIEQGYLACYVDGRQVGSLKPPREYPGLFFELYEWVKRLDHVGLLPRFPAVVRNSRGKNVIGFYTPPDALNDHTVSVKKLMQKQHGQPNH